MDTRRVDASSRSDFAADRSSGEDWPGDWFDEIPKVELHLHLEGAIPLPAMWELVKKYGATDQVPTIEALARRFRYTDFDHFIEAWVWKCGLTRELDDFTLIAQAVATHLRDQNIRYVRLSILRPITRSTA